MAEKQLNAMDAARNKLKPTLKLHYVEANSEDCAKGGAKIIEIGEKRLNRISNDKYLDRPLKRNDFNFKFSTLNLHDWSVRIVKTTYCYLIAWMDLL